MACSHGQSGWAVVNGGFIMGGWAGNLRRRQQQLTRASAPACPHMSRAQPQSFCVATHLVQALPVVAVHLLQDEQHDEEHQQRVARQQEAHDGTRAEGCGAGMRQAVSMSAHGRDRTRTPSLPCSAMLLPSGSHAAGCGACSPASPAMKAGAMPFRASSAVRALA